MMKPKKLFLALLASTTLGSYSILLGQAPGFATLEFDSINFANADGVAVAGMQWGVIINLSQMEFNLDILDTVNAVPISASIGYDPFDINSEGFLSVGGIQTTDYYIPMAVTTVGGFIGSTEPIAMTVDTNAAYRINTAAGSETLQTQQYGIIWFSSNSATPGSYYGFYTVDTLKSFPDPSLNVLTLPNGGTITELNQRINQDLKVANLQVVPEPSVYAALLGGLALLVALRRRRTV